MSALSDLALFIGYTERIAEKATRESRKWKELSENLAESVYWVTKKAELWENLGACEGSEGDELWPDEPITIEEITRKVERLGDKPHTSG